MRPAGMKLAVLAQGRDNNFNLIRILAALAVLCSHSFPLSHAGLADPLAARLGMTAGSIAVDVFFITSGFLVTSSLMARAGLPRFFLARALRVFPALWVMLLLTVFVLGLSFTTQSASQYLADAATHSYLRKCATLFRGVSYHLPGVFAGNPLPLAVNGSLWSLPVEVRMYTVLALLWLPLAMLKDSRRRAFALVTALLAIVACYLVVSTHLQMAKESPALRLIFMFLTGAAYFCLRAYVPMRRGIFFGGAALLLLASLHATFFYVSYMLTLAYLVLYLAYVPGGAIRKFNRVGDYSYGVYIYAFPVQQSIAAMVPGISVPAMLGLAVAVTLPLAMLSWHLVEKRALRLKDRLLPGSAGSAG